MRVYAYPADLWAVGHYRVVWPAEQVAAAGWADVTVVPPHSDTGIGGFEVGGAMQDAWAPPDADVVVIQRPCKRALAQSVRLLQLKGVAVVVDVDDDLTCIDPLNPAWAGHHPRRDPDDNWEWLKLACRDATLVTASTPALLERFAAHGRGALLENCVPARFLDVPRVDEAGDRPTVGWAGSTHSHPRDLQVIGGAVSSSGLPFRGVGDPEGAARELGLPSAEGADQVEFEDWPAAVSALHVGLAPLGDTKFNRAKSWLKPLEYAALGVPYAFSPTPEYVRFCKSAPGLPAARPRHWAHALRELSRPGTRAALSAAGREAVRERHTYEGNAWRWAEAWTVAAEHGRPA